MTRLGELDLEEAAKEAAGNWRKFTCFAWFRQRDLEKPEDWAIIYTHHRDSGLLDQSNAAVIEAAMQSFTEGDDPDVMFESHSHWAVGEISGFSVRVFNEGRITEAFRKYHELAQRLADYPILDESDYSQREFDATHDNIGLAAWRLKHDFDLPEDWQGEVYRWLADHRHRALENADDQGGWPDEDDLQAAFEGLGFQRAA